MRRMMPFAGVSIFALCVGGALLPASPTHASDIVVTPTSLNGWAFSNTDNSGTNASGQFVVGPAPAPLGIGSANLIVGDATSSEILINTSVAPGSSSFTTLSYETYVTTSTPGSGAAPTLQFDLYDGATYEGRLVFDPGLLGTVTDDTWQTWDPLTEDAWYFSDLTSFHQGCVWRVLDCRPYLLFDWTGRSRSLGRQHRARRCPLQSGKRPEQL